MFRSRVAPALLTFAVVGGGIYWQTAGGMQQPRSRAAGGDSDQQSDVSGTLQAAAGTGGSATRDESEQKALAKHDPKDTRLYSRSQTADSKRSSAKTRD